MFFKKISLWINTVKGASISTGLIVAFILFAIFMPIILTSKTSKGNIQAYNRDGNSGTRASFDEKIILKDNIEKFSDNVSEVKGSESMQTRVENDNNGIGYASAGQLIEYDASTPDELKYKHTNKINVLNFCTLEKDTGTNSKTQKCYAPTINNIDSDVYKGVKSFNIFWRVDKNEVSNWKFDPENLTTPWTIPSNATDDFIAGYGLFNYLLYSTEVTSLLPLAPKRSSRVPFSGNVLNKLVKKLKRNSSETNLKIFTSGSTSIINSLNDATANNSKNSFNSLMNESLKNNTNYNEVDIVSSHSGSGDAFKKDLKNENPSLGFLSREFKNKELSEWGFKDGNELEKSNSYMSWENDAIVVFVNKNNTVFTKNKQGISREQLKSIYLKGNSLQWDSLFPISTPIN